MVSIREDRIHLGACVLVTLIGLAIRLALIDQPMRYDEACTLVRYASQPLSVALTNYTLPNNHLFHTLLVRAAYLLLGGEPWAVRLPALLAGVLLIPVTYVAGRRLYDSSAGLLAAALVACSFPFIFYSTNARGYTLLSLIFVALLSLGPTLIATKRLSAWISYAVLIAVGFYTIPTMLYPFGMVVTWLFLSVLWQGRRIERPAAVAQHKYLVAFSALGLLMAGLAYIPVAFASGTQSLLGNRFVRPHTLRYLVEQFPVTMAAIWAEWNMNMPLLVSLILAGGAIASLVLHRRIGSRSVPAVLGLPLFVLPVMLVQRVVPATRVWMFLLPLYLLMASAGLVFVCRPLVRARFWPVISLAVALAIGVGVVRSGSVAGYPDTGLFPEAESVAAWLQDRLQPGDRIVLTDFPGRWPLQYHFMRRGLPGDYFTATLSEARRVVALVNEAGSETCAGVLADFEWPMDRYLPAREVGRVGGLTVFALERTE